MTILFIAVKKRLQASRKYWYSVTGGCSDVFFFFHEASILSFIENWLHAMDLDLVFGIDGYSPFWADRNESELWDIFQLQNRAEKEN